MSEKMNENSELKYFDILATFNDSTYIRGGVMAINYTQANKAFFELPSMVEAMEQVMTRKLMQVTLCERDMPPADFKDQAQTQVQ